MLNIILFIIIISTGSVLGALYNKKYEEVLPLTIMSIIVFLYLFYINDLLNIGFYVMNSIIILIYIYVLYKCILNKDYKKYVKNLITPGTFIFLLLIAIFYIICRNNFVQLWDELRVWGTLPKLLFQNGRLQLGEEVMFYPDFQSYFPGMSIFQYVFLKLGTSFKENIIFLAYYIFGGVILLSMLPKINFKKQIMLIPIFAFIILILPLTFYNSNFNFGNYYATLFIDPIIGIMFGYIMYLIYQNVFKDKFSVVTFVLALSTIILLKDSGLIFAIMAIVSSLLLESCVFKTYEYSTNKNKIKYYAKIILPIMAIVLIIISWKICINKFGISNTLGNPINSEAIVKLIRYPVQEQMDTIKAYVHALLNDSIIRSNFSIITNSLTYINILILLTMFSTIIYWLLKKEYRKKIKYIILLMIASNIIYVIGTGMLYVFTLGDKLPSYPRYINTILLSQLILYVYILIESIVNKKYKNKNAVLIFAITTICVSIIIFPFKKTEYYLESATQRNISDIHSNIINKISSYETKNVYLVIMGDSIKDILLHHQIYFNLIDDNIFIKNFSFYTNIENKNPDMFVQELIDNKYDYIYFADINEKTNNKFRSIFEENEIVSKVLYGINRNTKKLYKVTEKRNDSPK